MFVLLELLQQICRWSDVSISLYEATLHWCLGSLLQQVSSHSDVLMEVILINFPSMMWSCPEAAPSQSPTIWSSLCWTWPLVSCCQVSVVFFPLVLHVPYKQFQLSLIGLHNILCFGSRLSWTVTSTSRESSHRAESFPFIDSLTGLMNI